MSCTRTLSEHAVRPKKVKKNSKRKVKKKRAAREWGRAKNETISIHLSVWQSSIVMHSFTGDRLFPISNCEEYFCIHVCMYKPLHLYMLDGERERKDKIKLNAATMISTAKKYCVHWTENIYVHRLNRRSMFSRFFRISLTFFILVDSLLISTSPSYFFGCLSWHNLSYFAFFFLKFKC